MRLLNVSLDMEVSPLLRKEERRNNIELYFSSMRLSLLTLAVSNAENYVHIFTELLVVGDLLESQKGSHFTVLICLGDAEWCVCWH